VGSRARPREHDARAGNRLRDIGLRRLRPELEFRGRALEPQRVEIAAMAHGCAIQEHRPH
jgi:hypothetical protein